MFSRLRQGAWHCSHMSTGQAEREERMELSEVRDELCLMQHKLE